MAAEKTYDVASLRVALLHHLGERAEAYPTALERGFPHVLARMVDLWGTAKMDQYLHGLLVADRPNRQGFPAAVAKEIFQLSVIHGALGLTPDHEGAGWAGVTHRDLERWRQDRD